MADYALNGVVTSDRYTPASTMAAPGARRWVITISNARVLYQFGMGWPNPVWGPEIAQIPAILTLERAFDAIRFRSATSTPAVVDVSAATEATVTGA